MFSCYNHYVDQLKNILCRSARLTRCILMDSSTWFDLGYDTLKTVKSVLSGHLEIDKTNISMTDGSLMQVKSFDR